MRVLVIAYYYPPLGGGGARRPARWAASLPQLGHEVAVLSHSYGASALDGPVLRVADPSFNCARRGLRRLHWLAYRTLTELRNRTGDPRSIYWWWQRRVQQAMPAIVDSFRPEVVLATYSPVETLELGLQLSCDHAIPLVADFRDGLTCEPIEAQRMARFPAVARAYQRLEAQVISRAAAVTAAHPRVADDLSERYGVTTVSVLPNSFDPGGWDQVAAADLDPQQLHVVHTGSFAASDGQCDIAPLVAALEELMATRPTLAERLRIHQLGRLTRRERGLLGGLCRRGVVIDHGEVEHRRCLAFQKRADLALLVTATTRPSVTPGKLFEYLGAGCPVLALAAGSYAAEIVQSTGVGWTVAADDRKAIAAALDLALDPRARAALQPDARRIAAFALPAHAATLDRVLRSVR